MKSTSEIINTLMQAANEVENENQQQAIDTLSTITAEIASLQASSSDAENEAGRNQQAVLQKINELIVSQSVAHQECDNVKAEVQNAYVNVAAKKVSIANLNQQINANQAQSAQLNAQLTDCQRRIDDLNDNSVGSIFKSIFTLGIDRTVKAIGIEIDGVRNNIHNTQNTINAFNNEIYNLRSQINDDKNNLIQLNNTVNEKQNKINDLHHQEMEQHENEEIERRKLAYFTNVNLFYIKLKALLNNVSNKVKDIADIASILDNNTPTVASFDPSKQDLITLKEAILRFGNNQVIGATVKQQNLNLRSNE